MVFSRNAIHSALWLVCTMLSLGVFYVVQQAPFLGAVQIIVYTGAIMILFLFVLMLVGRDSSDSVVETLRGQRVAATVLGHRLRRARRCRHRPRDPAPGRHRASDGAEGGNGNIPAIAELLFTRYLLAFEVTSALLITAAVGAMVLAHIEREPGSRQSQKELSRARFLTDRPQTLPGPGVYARANSVAAPGAAARRRSGRELLATGIEPQGSTRCRAPRAAEQLGSPDDALGTLDPAPGWTEADR